MDVKQHFNRDWKVVGGEGPGKRGERESRRERGGRGEPGGVEGRRRRVTEGAQGKESVTTTQERISARREVTECKNVAHRFYVRSETVYKYIRHVGKVE